jgi:omega-amidase
MRVHLVQMEIAWEDRASNFRTVEAMIADARPDRGDVIVLPELFDSGFSLNVEVTADEPPIGAGETRRFLAGLARSRGVVVHGSWTGLAGRTEESGGKPTGLNFAAAFGTDGHELYRYAKIHPFTYGREGERFAGGDRVVCRDVGDAGASERLSVCPAICYDLRFPELFRSGLEMGAEAYVLGANWPEARQSHWRALCIARAIENQAWVLSVNRVGSDPHLRYAGGSLVVDPRGEVVCEGDDEARVVSATISRAAVESWRKIFPAWRDRSTVLR